LTKVYFPAHHRLVPWVIGIMLGYFMYEKRGKKMKINRFIDAFLWIFFISLFFFINFIYFPFVQEGFDTWYMLPHALYGSFFRVCWCLPIAWIIFACQNGSGGIIRWFLSLRFWQPLGRMGLSIYLTHRVYQLITTHNQKQPMQWDLFTELQKYFGDVLVAILLGIVLYLAVETPVMLIENYLHEKLKQPKKKVIQENANVENSSQHTEVPDNQPN
jgi:peptidoglycan/LPS O-acetylase OafA/YrhL